MWESRKKAYTCGLFSVVIFVEKKSVLNRHGEKEVLNRVRFLFNVEMLKEKGRIYSDIGCDVGCDIPYDAGHLWILLHQILDLPDGAENSGVIAVLIFRADIF